MDGAKNARQALVQRVAKLAQTAGGEKALLAGKTYKKGEASSVAGLSEKARALLEDFQKALENDLSTPVAVSLIQKAVKDAGLSADEALELVRRMDSVTGLKLIDCAEKQLSVPVETASVQDSEAEEINALVAERTEAKKAKNFARADEIRKLLADKGIVITDTPNGAVWERK